MKTSIFILLVINGIFLHGQSWEIYKVGIGMKPDLAVGTDGIAHIGFMSEDINGYVAYTRFENPGNIISDTVNRGYYYGPVAMAIDHSNKFYLSLHDHDSEDERIYDRSATGFWNIVDIADDGHDGWDTDIFIDQNNNLHTSSVDPSATVEYAYRIGDNWTKESIPTERVNYSHGTGIAVRPNGQVLITYFNEDDNDLKLATKIGTEWTVSTVDAKGGRFSQIAIDQSDRVHIVYANQIANATYEIKYATSVSNSWNIYTMDTLTAVNNGARRIVTIAFDENNSPTIAYTDAKKLKFAQLKNGIWNIENVLDYSSQSKNLGACLDHQILSDTVHFVTYTRDLDVLYIKGHLSTTAEVETYSIMGKIVNDKNLPVSGALVTVKGSSKSVTTSTTGNFTLENLTNNVSLTVTKSDDAARGISSSDLVLIIKHIVDVQPFTNPLQLRSADVNNSGNVSASDLVLLKNLILGKTTSLPSGLTWIFDADGRVFTAANAANIIEIKAWKYGDVNNSATPNN